MFPGSPKLSLRCWTRVTKQLWSAGTGPTGAVIVWPRPLPRRGGRAGRMKADADAGEWVWCGGACLSP